MDLNTLHIGFHSGQAEAESKTCEKFQENREVDADTKPTPTGFFMRLPNPIGDAAQALNRSVDSGETAGITGPNHEHPQATESAHKRLTESASHNGRHSGGGYDRTCEHCGQTFHCRRNSDTKNNPNKFCSRECHSNSRKNRTPACIQTFITPPSTKAERIRANGLVNKRLKLGWFTKPTACQKCSRSVKLDGHHEDYMQPGHVAYVCRSCHMKAHQDPSFLSDVVPIDTNYRRDGITPGHGCKHHKGGRKGPTGKAKGRAPLHRVVRVENMPDGTMTEVLTCGHRFNRPIGLIPKQRRCLQCRDAQLRSSATEAA